MAMALKVVAAEVLEDACLSTSSKATHLLTSRIKVKSSGPVSTQSREEFMASLATLTTTLSTKMVSRAKMEK